MKIEEIRKLILDEQNGKLRNPNTLDHQPEWSIKNKVKTFGVVKTIIDNSVIEVLNTMVFKRNIKRNCYGAKIKYRKEFGDYSFRAGNNSGLIDGTFYDSHNLFENNTYPEWVLKGNVFSNSILHALRRTANAKVVSGIAYIKEPFLHTVVVTDDKVIDYKHNLVMNKDLYFRLTNFEILSKIDRKDIKSNLDIIKHNNINTKELCFAFDDIISALSDVSGVGV